MKKVCTKCSEEKPLEDFYKDVRRKDGRASCCKQCHHKVSNLYNKTNRDRCNENQRKHRERNIEQTKTYSLKYHHGITLEEALSIYRNQNGLCGICEKELNFWNNKTHIDHCHDSNEIRGILCHSCNTGLGKLGDNIEGLEKAIKYLRKNNE